jgi:hypothetical protein
MDAQQLSLEGKIEGWSTSESHEEQGHKEEKAKKESDEPTTPGSSATKSLTCLTPLKKSSTPASPVPTTLPSNHPSQQIPFPFPPYKLSLSRNPSLRDCLQRDHDGSTPPKEADFATGEQANSRPCSFDEGIYVKQLKGTHTLAMHDDSDNNVIFRMHMARVMGHDKPLTHDAFTHFTSTRVKGKSWSTRDVMMHCMPERTLEYTTHPKQTKYDKFTVPRRREIDSFGVTSHIPHGWNDRCSIQTHCECCMHTRIYILTHIWV